LFSERGQRRRQHVDDVDRLGAALVQVRCLPHRGSRPAAFRPWKLMTLVSEATASLITLRRRSEPRFWPLLSIGVEEPMFVAGAIAATSAASVIQTPPRRPREPLGET
jgi:hypothetical protein